MNENQKPVQRDANKIIEVLFKISEAVSHTRNLNELYKAIHQNLGEIFNVDNFYIALHNADKDSIIFPYYVDEKDVAPGEIFNFSETASITGRIIKDRKPIIFFRKDIIQLAGNLNENPIGTIPETLSVVVDLLPVFFHRNLILIHQKIYTETYLTVSLT